MGIEEWQTFEPASVGDMEYALSLYDKDGNAYERLSNTEKRVYVSIDEIPEHVKNAFIGIEDARFYSHKGVDYIRVAGALVEDIKSGDLKQGASTITQQLVKLSVLTSDKNFSRKLAEMIMALKLERVYEKDEILEFYLNRVYFGNGAYGIEAAAQEYFGKSAGALTISEGAMLAAVLKSPTNYDPREYYDNAVSRRNLVLQAMKDNGLINGVEYANAVSEQIEIAEKAADTYNYGYYTDMVLSDATTLLTMTYSELMSSGYKIYTYLDQDIQSWLETYAENPANFPANASDGEECQTAAVVLTADANGVAAVLGGREHTAKLSLNRATSMRRQPGSAIKPIMVYTPAIEYGGYSTVSLLMDQPEDFNGYAPRNSGSNYRGWVTLRDSVAYSINIPAVKLLQEIGVDTAKNYASSVGIVFAEDDTSLTLALGGFTDGVTPLELAGSYMPFASGGYYSSPSSIQRIEDKDGNVIYERTDEKKSVLSAETSYIMNSLLSSTVDYGTASSLKGIGVDVRAKTGTSSYEDAKNNKDAWTVAYNSQYIVCSWMGFDKTDDDHSLPQGMTGGTLPAQMVGKLFEHIYQNRTAPASLDTPEGIVEVDIDKTLLEESLEVKLPVHEGETITECFTTDSIPDSLSPAPQNMLVEADGTGKPVITFSGYSEYDYVLERKAVGSDEWEVIGRTKGNGTLYDTRAAKGQAYIYRLAPEQFYYAENMAQYLYIPTEL